MKDEIQIRTPPDFVNFGYVMNDDAISILPEISALYKTMLKFSMADAKIVFPLTKFKKADIWEFLKPQYRDLVTWCESPIPKESCDCSSCSRMRPIIGLNKAEVESVIGLCGAAADEDYSI